MINVKSDYKRIGLGEVPAGWNYTAMNTLGNTYGGLSGKTKKDFENGTEKFISYKMIFKNPLMINQEFEYVNVAENENQNKVIYGDVLFTTSSETPEEVAMSSAFLVENNGNFFLNSFSFGFRFNDLSKIEPKFYGYYFRGSQFRKETFKLAQGSTRYNISKVKLAETFIHVPPLKEQQKIAEILSTVDEQIEQTDQLIEKTKELKKGLMQQLLTKGIGHTEFKHSEISEIPIEWEIKTLKEISSSKGDYGIGASAIEYNRNKPRYLRITDISEDGKLLDNDIRGFDSEKYEPYILKVNDIVFARTGNSTGKSYIYKKEDGDLVYAGFLIKFSIDQNISNSQFIFYTTQTLRYKNWVSKMSVRSGQPGINSKEYGELLIPVPSLEEQHKIAEIISSVDEDIDVYEEEKSKYEELKKGLMQQLLTGKTRVKVD